jgi:ABC-type transport system involved in Fe-S cluster assembly fused permease/ATPase subunit
MISTLTSQKQRQIRKVMNEKDNEASGTALDSLLNFEVFYVSIN